MIIVNGTLEWKTLSAGGGLDPETGFPVPPEETWSDPVPCQTIPLRTDRLARGSQSGERFTDLSFNVLIEQGSPAGTFLRLRDLAGNVIGEYQLKGAEPLEAVGQLRLTV